MERVDEVPVYDAPESGYDRALHDGVVHVRGTGFPWQKGANVYIAGHRVGYPPRVTWCSGPHSSRRGMDLRRSAGTQYTYRIFRACDHLGRVGILVPSQGRTSSAADLYAPRLLAPLIVQGEGDRLGPARTRMGPYLTAGPIFVIECTTRGIPPQKSDPTCGERRGLKKLERGGANAGYLLPRTFLSGWRCGLLVPYRRSFRQLAVIRTTSGNAGYLSPEMNG